MVERFHRRLKNTFRARCAAANWVDHLPWVLLGLRAAPREDDGSTPTQEVFGTPLILPGQFLDSPEIPPKVFLGQFSKTLSAAEHTATRHNTAAARQPLPRLPDDLARASMVFVRRDGHVPPLQPLYDGPYAVIRRSLHHFTLRIGTRWTRCLHSDSNHARILQRRRRCPGFVAARPPPYASGISRRRGPWRPAMYTSPQSYQPNRAGNRFPLARRQGFLHAPPPFSTTSPLGPLAAAERRQD
jgi:hypothetical protein